ncbi:MAG: hypothetical protein ABW185_29885, partial [Sedimenticola sp.]
MVEAEKEEWTGYVEDIDSRMERLQLADTSMDERVVRRKNRELLRAEEEMRCRDVREDGQKVDSSVEQRKGTANAVGQSPSGTTSYKVTTEPNARLGDTSPVTKLTLGEDSVDLYHKQDRSASTPLTTGKAVRKSDSFSDELEFGDGSHHTFSGYDEKLHSKATPAPREKVAVGSSCPEPRLLSPYLAGSLDTALEKENVAAIPRSKDRIPYSDGYSYTGTPTFEASAGVKPSTGTQKRGVDDGLIDHNARTTVRTAYEGRDSTRPPSFLEAPDDQRQAPAMKPYEMMDSSAGDIRYLLEERKAEERLAQLKREEGEVEQRVRERILFLKRKEQEMEVDNQRLIEEERTRISRLQAMESKQRQMEDNWRREYTLMKKKEEDLLMERQRQETEEQNRIDRMYELERRQKQTEEEQRQQVLRNLKTEDDRREYEVRGRLLKEREQEQRKLQRQAAEQRKREQEIQVQLESGQREPTLRDLKEEEDIRERAVQERIRKEQEHMELRKRASEQREREQGMHDQQERLMNWEADVRRKQEQNPTTDRLGMLFEAEQRLAHAIQEEIQRKEEQQKESEQIPTYQSRSRLGNTLLMNKDGPGNVYVKPTVTSFSGTEPIPKNECSFEIWTLEVECIMNTYPDYLVSQAIRQSLKGEGKRVLLPLGPHATAQAIIEKMESVFGNVVSG